MTAGAHDAVTLGCYALGVLDAHERRGVEQHLSWCGPCRAQIAEFGHIRTVLDGIPREALVEELMPDQLRFEQPGPMPSELVLQRALRQIRSEGATRSAIPTPRASPQGEVVAEPAAPGQHRRSRGPAYLVAAALVALALGGGAAAVYGFGSADGTQNAQPTDNITGDGPARTIVNSDSKTGVSMTADVTAIQGWVKVSVTVTGLPAGQNCQLVLVGKDGRREPVKGWISTEEHRLQGWRGDGNAGMPMGDIKSITVENDQGRRFVTAQLP